MFQSYTYIHTSNSADIKEGDLIHPLYLWNPYIALTGLELTHLHLVGLKMIYHHDHLNSHLNNMVSEFLLVFLRLSEVLHYTYIGKEYLS